MQTYGVHLKKCLQSFYYIGWCTPLSSLFACKVATSHIINLQALMNKANKSVQKHGCQLGSNIDARDCSSDLKAFHISNIWNRSATQLNQNLPF